MISRGILDVNELFAGVPLIVDGEERPRPAPFVS